MSQLLYTVRESTPKILSNLCPPLYSSFQMSNSRSRYSSHSRSPYWDRSSCLSSISRSRSRSSFRSHESSDVENPGHNLYVTGLSPRVTMRDLEKHFSSEGTVVDIHLVLDPWTRESRGFGFVAMATVKDADRCLKYLDQSVLKGRKIMVEKARRRRGRTPTPGRYLGLKSARVRHRSPSYSPPRGRTSNSPAYYYGRDRSYSPCYRRYRSRSRSSDRSYSPYNRGVHASSRYYREDRSHSPYYRRYRSRSRSCSYTPCRRRRYNLSRHYSRRDLSYSPSNRRYRSPSRSLSPPHYSRSHVGRRRERSCSSHSVSKSYSQSPTPHYHCSRRYRSISPSMSPRGRRNGRRSCSRSDSPRRRRRSYSRSDSARQWRQNSYYSSASSRSRSVSDSVSPARHNYSGGRSWSGNPCVHYSRSVSPSRRSQSSSG